ncbi:hypothetical protein [Dyella nitratireducens]|uniref:Uncharacterized protein n=1 Tax=Dyella nitratireducens TaxID=1849580 RepID=A0ABQ1GDX3_9GAMM|nr:hypothetical protein [Dyella nitratireducens]GGA41936.1 hypothetical protein GCM10010981_33690 [Dyella nitratireducens]GLQ42075.1 hypothetical protein GCM10007902_19250 [Dyella nitratireducens]
MRSLSRSVPFALALLLGAIGQAHAENYVLTFDAVKVMPGERIVGFDIKIKAAYVSSMKRVPLGWHIEIDNQPSWNTQVTGGISIGAAALDKDALNHLFLVTTDKEMGALEVTGEIVTTSDFEHERHLALKSSDVHATLIPQNGNSK